jgi:SAM-dependent methyltransferase
MINSPDNFDSTWDEIYQKGHRHQNRYPFDTVVRFVFSHSPKDIPRNEVSVFEIGCGVGNNLWFAAREGFQVSGIDASKAAINLATKRFDEEGLKGDLRVGDANQLPYDDNCFDIAIDRAALSHTPKETITKSIDEIHRVLKPGGKFHFNPFGDRCSSAQRLAHNSNDKDGNLTDISDGYLAGAGLASVYSRDDVERLFENGWELLSMMCIEHTNMNEPLFMKHEEWIVIAEKTG